MATTIKHARQRRGAIVVLAAVFLAVIVGVLAFATDMGYVVLARTQLQAAADSAALAAAGTTYLSRAEMEAAAQQFAGYPVGVGLDTDYGFMDRMARMGATANSSGQSPRGSGNPADYEARLTTIFQKIINNPKLHLVQ